MWARRERCRESSVARFSTKGNQNFAPRFREQGSPEIDTFDT